MLQARPCLSWRDVLHVLALTAVRIRGIHRFRSEQLAPGYVRNAAGLQHSDLHGFGLLDAWRAVQLSRVRALPHLKQH